MDWQERIVTDREILSGQPTVKGTGLAVAFILDRLADGESEAALLSAHKELCSDDVRACLRYASERVAPQKVSPISDMIASESIPQEVRAMLVKADERFRYYDYCEGSRLLWQAVEWTVKDFAIPRGWPVKDEEQLEQAIEWLDKRTDEKHNLVGDFLNALMFQDNANHDGQILSPDAVDMYAPLVPRFIEDLFAATDSLDSRK